MKREDNALMCVAKKRDFLTFCFRAYETSGGNNAGPTSRDAQIAGINRLITDVFGVLF